MKRRSVDPLRSAHPRRSGRETLAMMLAVGLLVFGLWACGGSSTTTSSSSKTGGSSAGRALFLQKCSLCHGEDGGGNKMGPDIRGASEHWTEESLMEYLPDAPAYESGDERLATLRAQYPAVMTKFPDLSEKELRDLAQLVLSLDPGS